MTESEFCDMYVGTPWVNRGESLDGIDCWGLVLQSFREIDGVELPVISGYNDPLTQTEDAVTPSDLKQFKEAQPTNGAIMCIFNNKGQMMHVGRCLNGRIIHATESLGVRVGTYKKINSKHRNVRYYKYD